MVSRIIDSLERRRLVVRGEPLRGNRGQPATPISIDPDGAYSIGCEIGWRHLTIVICDLRGRILGSHRREYSFPEVKWIFPEVASLARLMINLLAETDRDRVRTLGVSLPSCMGRNLTLLGVDAAAADQWNDIDLRAELERVTGLKVHLINDGNSACWAELVLRPRPRPDNFAYLFVGTLLGGGVVAEGRLHEGPTGNSGNLGSVLVPDGQGGLEVAHLVSSLHWLEKSLPDGTSLPRTDEDWEALAPLVSDWLDRSACGLAHVIVNTAAVLEITLAIIDGELPRPILAQLIEKTIEKLSQIKQYTHEPPPVSAGTIGSLAAATGAAFRPLYLEYFAGDLGSSQLQLSPRAPVSPG